MNISRRNFLHFFITSLLLSKSWSTAYATGAREKIIVVGAGIAGIAAARMLADSGYDVTVLEARSVLGGRIRTDDTLGVPVDLGASFIHGTRGNPLVELANRFNLETYNTEQDGVFYANRQGRFFSRRALSTASREFETLLQRLVSLQDDLDDDRSIQSVVVELLRSVRMKRGSTVGGLVEFLVKSGLALEFGADLKEMSLLYLEDEGEFLGPDLLLRSGYGPLVTGLSQGLDIRFSERVVGITQFASGVTVRTGERSYEGERVIVTLPLGVLKRSEIEFTPPLPESKQGALRRLKMGVLDKTYFLFPRVFWQTQRERVGYIGNTTARPGFDIPEFYTLDKVVNSPILFGFTSGSTARKLEGVSTELVAARTMKSLRRMFGKSIPDPEIVLRTAWSSDPFTHGSYSFIPVGGRGEDYEVLAQPVSDRVLFAGEATNRVYPGTVHGAYLSGIREAERIITQTT
jgi:monoamine oxidase